MTVTVQLFLKPMLIQREKQEENDRRLNSIIQFYFSMISEMADEGRKQDEANKMRTNCLVSIFLSHLPF